MKLHEAFYIINMFKQFALFTSVLIFSLVSNAQGVESCHSRAESWVKTDGPNMMALRSNACHYWTWMKNNVESYFVTETRDIINYVGYVAGDAHHENFSHIFSNEKRVYVVNDMDDSGIAPFFLDYIKFLGVSHSVSENESVLSFEKMFEAYIKGVKQEEWSQGVPELLKSDFQVTKDEFQEEALKKAKNKTSKKDFDKDDGLYRFKKLSSELQNQFLELEERYFATALPTGYKIQARAISKKLDGGGSMGLTRYQYYLQDPDEVDNRLIVEFKPMGSPAVDVYNDEQADPEIRLQEAMSIFWPTDYPEEFKIVGQGEETFLMRPKWPRYVDFSTKDFETQPSQFTELSIYIAFELGRLHGKQLDSDEIYKILLEENQDKLIEVSRQMVNDYLEQVKKER